MDEKSKNIFGFNKDVVSISELTKRIHPNDIKNVNETLIEILNSEPENKFLEVYRIVLKDGSIKWIEASMIIIPKEENLNKEQFQNTISEYLFSEKTPKISFF